MLAPEGSQASPGSRPRSSSFTHAGSLTQYGTALLRYVFRRVSRCGPRLLLYLAAFLTALLVVTEFLSRDLSDPLASRTSSLWLYRLSFLDRLGKKRRKRPPQAEANARDAVAGGGLRIVVFGENDVATSRLQNIPMDARALGDNNSTAWPEELCVELRCTTYHSLVPALDLPRRSLSSNALYAEVTETVLASSTGALPANNFSYVADAYPVPAQVPDLRAQVDAFLAQPPPQRPPKETVWIFSVGQWDIWSLAAFPSGPADDMVVSIVSDLFAQIEALYRAAHDARSVAYSDPTATPHDDAGHESKARTPPAVLPWNNTAAAPFRVMVPLLVDPSLLPGWHLDRPAAPPLHPKSEHVRRAVRLTKLWNERVEGEMAAWVAKSQESEEAKAAEEDDGSSKPSNDTATANGRRAAPAASAGPRLVRDGTVFPMPDYILDAMIDGQMKIDGLSDRKNFGKLPKAEAFADVRKPCLGPAAGAVAAAATAASASETFTVEMTPPAGKGKKSKPGSRRKTEETVAASTGTGDAASDLVLCGEPDRHLFFTAFSLGQRGIQEIGRLGASLLRANETLRSAWTTARTASGVDRLPASWKEYDLA